MATELQFRSISELSRVRTFKKRYVPSMLELQSSHEQGTVCEIGVCIRPISRFARGIVDCSGNWYLIEYDY